MIVGGAATTAQPAPISRAAVPEADAQAIRRIIADQVTAWNQADATAHSKNVPQDCVFTNTIDMMTMGRAPFEAQHRKIFAGSHWMPPGAKVTNFRRHSRLEQVLVKAGGEWGITCHNMFVLKIN